MASTIDSALNGSQETAAIPATPAPTGAPDRRAELLAIGRQLFAKHAYDELSIDDVAAAAGVAKGLLYYYFTSKRGFYLATIRAEADELLELAQPDPALPPAERLHIWRSSTRHPTASARSTSPGSAPIPRSARSATATARSSSD
jgi:AcrR family transcriptional regulator